MNNRPPGVFIIMFVLAFVGLWQFSAGVQSVDIVGLFASRALAGAAIAGFFVTRNRK